MPASWQRALAALAVTWSLLAAGSAVRAARALPSDPMARLEAEFRVLIPDLPPVGEVGYLERYDGGSEESVRMHYAAQYALAPRVVAGRITGQEFVIVAEGTERPGGDPRLKGYVPVARTPVGHRVFRRFAP